MGETRPYGDGTYGNAVLTRLPVLGSVRCDLSLRRARAARLPARRPRRGRHRRCTSSTVTSAWPSASGARSSSCSAAFIRRPPTARGPRAAGGRLQRVASRARDARPPPRVLLADAAHAPHASRAVPAVPRSTGSTGTSSSRARSFTCTAAVWPASPPITCRSSPACGCSPAAAPCHTSPATPCRRPSSQRHELRAPRVAHAVQRDRAARDRAARVRAAGGARAAAGPQVSRPRSHAPLRAGAGRLHRARRLQPHGRAAPDDHGAARAGPGADRGAHDGRRGGAEDCTAVGAAPLRGDAHRRRRRDRAGHRLVRRAGRLLARARRGFAPRRAPRRGRAAAIELRRILAEWQARGEPLATYAQFLGHGVPRRAGRGPRGRSTRCSTRWGPAGLPTPSCYAWPRSSATRRRPTSRAQAIAARAAPLLWRLRALVTLDALLLIFGVVAVSTLWRRRVTGAAVAGAPLPPPWSVGAGVATLIRGGALASIALVGLLTVSAWLADRPLLAEALEQPLMYVPALLLAWRALLAPAGLGFALSLWTAAARRRVAAAHPDDGGAGRRRRRHRRRPGRARRLAQAQLALE